MYDPQDIVKRIAGYLINDSSKTEGSFSMDNIQAVSQELAMMYYMTILPIDDKYFLDTAQNEFLDRRALDFNEKRNPATPAIGIVKIKGTAGIVIPVKTGVQSETQTYETDVAATIPESGYIEIPVTCTVSGTAGNISAYAIKQIRISDAITGIEVSNPKPFAGGTNEEDDESFRHRILEKIQRPYTSGNCNDYIRWAKQVSGVGNALCVSCWNGNGTVKVIVLSSTGGIPDDVIINNVIEYIEEQRPIGASVTVVPAVPKSVTIAADIKVVSGFIVEEIKAEFMIYLQEYLTDKAFGVDKTLSYFKISDLLYNVKGVSDVMDYKLNDQHASLSATADEFFQLQEVIINVTG